MTHKKDTFLMQEFFENWRNHLKEQDEIGYTQKVFASYWTIRSSKQIGGDKKETQSEILIDIIFDNWCDL